MTDIITQTIIEDIRSIIIRSKNMAIRAVDSERVRMYWHIGRAIFEEEQKGKQRAAYGEYLIKYLSERLQPEFGSGFSPRQLELFRQLFRTFPIANAVRSQLSWTHYRQLIRIDNQDKREFYIAESIKNNWTSRQMERQINSQLFERLLLSNDKESVLIEIKTNKITHKDIGQLQMYVNYFDRVEKKSFENPTIGILLCADKNNSVVKFTLPENSNIIASQYQLYLPSEDALMAEVKKEITNFQSMSKPVPTSQKP